jgi:hypothetical protein
MRFKLSDDVIAAVKLALQEEERQVRLRVCEGCQADLASAHALAFALCVSSTSSSV